MMHMQTSQKLPLDCRCTIIHKNAIYHMEVQESPTGVPLFALQPANTTERFLGTTPTSPWALLALRRGELEVMNGPHAFGFTHPLIASLILARRAAPRHLPSHSASQTPSELMTFPPEAPDSAACQTSSGSPADFGAFSYDSREDLPIREWKGKGGKRDRTEGLSDESEEKDTPFGQLIRAAEFLTNEEKRSSSEPTERVTATETKPGKRKARAEPRAEPERKAERRRDKKKRLSDLGDAGKGSGSAGHSADCGGEPNPETHVAEGEIPVAGFLERRNEGKRKVKLSKRGEEMAQQLRSPKRARRSPETGGSGNSSETGRAAIPGALQTEFASLNRKERNRLKEAAEEQKADPKGDAADDCERNPSGKRKTRNGGFTRRRDSGLVGVLEAGAKGVPDEETLGGKKQIRGYLKRFLPGGDDSSSARETALVCKVQRPVKDVSKHAAKKEAGSVFPGLESPRKLHLDVVNGEISAVEWDAKGNPKRENGSMTKGWEMQKGGLSGEEAEGLFGSSRGNGSPEGCFLEEDEAEEAVQRDEMEFHTPAGSGASDQHGMRPVPLGESDFPASSAAEADGEGPFQSIRRVAEEFRRRTERPAFGSVERGRDSPVRGTDEVIAPVLGAQVSTLALPIFPVPPDGVLTSWTEQHLALLRLRGGSRWALKVRALGWCLRW
ncbi:hypothetical protein KFL_000070380 [Klebsormidium nitens]|uniref:Uncharacterized protein n=1 Tax=Klebsormidium nitens TaxID=105231 RepID=A0A1Y1HLM8_KLENI|nr:hypothetical protein KFL_000070380 [Klebsormidium nitens]|eukprot:GAQ78069.1 hypothetical protein KFL_000070380 [Klebsormidium nitens]